MKKLASLLTDLQLTDLCPLMNITFGSNFLLKHIFVSKYFGAECCCNILDKELVVQNLCREPH